MPKLTWVDDFFRHRLTRNRLWIYTLLVLTLGMNTLFLITQGGVPSAFAHIMYVPILMAAFFLNVPLTMLVSFISAMLSGPFMSLIGTSYYQETTQASLNRLFFFILVGVLVSSMMKYMHAQYQRLHTLQTHDYATNLPKLAAYQDRFKDYQNTQAVALTVLINNHDTLVALLGIEGYEDLLKQVYRVLKKIVPPQTLVMLGDQRRFWLLFDTCHNDTIQQLKSLSDVMHVEVKNIPLYLDFTLGQSVFDENTDSILVFKEADLAAIYAKQHKLSHSVFQQDHLKVQQDSERLAQLPKALEAGAFFLVYQPILDLHEPQAKEVEALIRWRHGQDILSPMEFIPLAEQTRLMNAISTYVIQQVITDWTHLQAQGVTVKMTLNLSQRNLVDQEFKEMFTALLKEHAVLASHLSVEITESTYMTNTSVAFPFIQQLSRLGVRIILDDFGKEYSSLALLRDIPIDAIKIDRSFIQGIEHDTARQAIIQTIIQLAEQLNLDVIAEGIENSTVKTLLKDLGCRYLQGYYFTRPLTLRSLTQWWEANDTSVS